MAKPTMRFRGFDDEWEQRKLGDVLDDMYNGQTPSRNKSEYWNGNIKWLSSGELNRGTVYDSIEMITEDGQKSANLRIVPKGTFIMAITGLEAAGTRGNCALLGFDTTLNQSCMALFPKKDLLTSDFLFQWYRKVGEEYGLNYTQGTKQQSYNAELIKILPISLPSVAEQKKIASYLSHIDHLITLHQRKCDETKKLKKYMLQKMFPQNGSKVPEIRFKGFTDEWEQRKLDDVVEFLDTMRKPLEGAKRISGPYPYYGASGIVDYVDGYLFDEELILLSEDGANIIDRNYPVCFLASGKYWVNNHAHVLRTKQGNENNFICNSLERKDYTQYNTGMAMPKLNKETCKKIPILCPGFEEQKKIGDYFRSLDNLITLHQRKLPFTRILRKYTKITKETTQMSELERILEEKLIEQLVYGDSQWTYRKDLKTEEDLWENFKYILEQNNKDRLNGEPLSDTEFEQVKNQLQFSSFYKAGEWLVGENGKVQVHVQRDTERLHLVVMNHEHIAGGSSVYEVINQYEALKSDEDAGISERDRRFDVTLLINGLPMIHIELKNKQHSYMEAFRQIKKYIGEGKFTGIFSAVQMFVVSNGVDTRYFAAASDTELNEKFMSGWVDRENKPVSDYLDFAKSVLRIPEAHEMIARYTVLDKDAKRLILLRPYQIHAIESIREASKTTKSGYVWHTTGSGKTLTSYKATRNLLMDIPSIDKAIFLIDRRDLDTQTTMAFQAYANNDSIDVDETSNVTDLKNKLKSGDRQVIVTTIQKLQILISKRIIEDTPEYRKIKNLKIAFVVDECHRAVTPKTKRELEHFFGRSLWYGFTGTPRFPENPYPQLGDLPRTTKDLYGECLHKYTIQNAIHDNAVLGFQVEHNGPKQITDETDTSAYDNEAHMLKVLDVILNKSYYKLGFQNGKGETYEGLLTTSSIQLAQKYYDLLLRVKKGETSLKIDERIRQVLPDFPKFAITYSVTENEEGSHVNQQKMQRSLDEYNRMFGTKYELSQIQSYNGNLNKRLARKDAKFKSRNEQLDLVIVVDRLLTGFDAPCLSTIFIDRQPMGPHDLIQAFSRTNRIFNRNKTYGQIVTFQAPKLFRKSVDDAVKLYSAGSTGSTFVADWEEVEPAFRKALAALRISAETPDEIADMSLKEKKVFVKIFQNFDRLFAQLKSFTKYEDSMLEEYCITQKEYEDYAGYYQNAMEEIRIANGDGKDQPGDDETQPADLDYELMAYSNTKIDYEYIINLIQNIVTPDEDSEDSSPEERQKRIDEVKQYVCELQKTNSKVAKIMTDLIYEIEMDDRKFRGKSILNIMEKMKYDCIDKVVSDFCTTWYASKEDVMYAAMHYRNGKIPNESVIKDTINYAEYKAAQEKPLPKFKYNRRCIEELGKILDEEIKPLINIA